MEKGKSHIAKSAASKQKEQAKSKGLARGGKLGQ